MITRIYSPNLARRLAQLTMLVSKIPIRMKTSTKKIAQQVLADSQEISPCVPEDTGALRSTGRVEATSAGHAVIYGGLAKNGVYVDYADQVHDDLSPRRYKRSGSGPKYVETHVKRRTPEGQVIINADLQATVTETIDG